MFSSIIGGFVGRTSNAIFNGVARFFFSRGVVKKLPPNAWNMYLAPFENRKLRHPTHIFPKQLMAAKPFLQELEDRLPAIKHKPALILWGDGDFAFRDEERRRFRAAFPNHRGVDLIGAGHFIQEDAPDAISAEISNWYGVSGSKNDTAPNGSSSEK